MLPGLETDGGDANVWSGSSEQEVAAFFIFDFWE